MPDAKINRRDFLKLAGMVPLSASAPKWARRLPSAGTDQNVIVLILDAFSALNVSLYGYARETTPNLARLAGRAIVYHNHFASSNFTTSGTASLLTGTLPWTHRALDDDGTIAAAVLPHNVFQLFDGYYRIAYSHNTWVVTLLNQFARAIEELVPHEKLYVGSYDGPIHTLFSRDDDAATVAWTRYIKKEVDGGSYSVFLSNLYESLHKRLIASAAQRFPLGLPEDGSKATFVLEDAVNWLKGRLPVLPRPFFGYFHFLPPHAPYRPPLEFLGRFDRDGLRPAVKPLDVFAEKGASADAHEERTLYDEFVLYADKAFGELFDSLDASGLLEDTWLIVTSDHGEMFERGFVGHGNSTLYQPLVRVPLLIFEPGRQTGSHIYDPTSAADILPTLMQLTGRPVPSWTEGTVLPPFRQAQPADARGVYAVTARKNGGLEPLHQATVCVVRGRYKLIYTFGYQALGVEDRIQLFDIESDPEELNDIHAQQGDATATLLAELKAKIEQADLPYRAA